MPLKVVVVVLSPSAATIVPPASFEIRLFATSKPKSFVLPAVFQTPPILLVNALPGPARTTVPSTTPELTTDTDSRLLRADLLNTSSARDVITVASESPELFWSVPALLICAIFCVSANSLIASTPPCTTLPSLTLIRVSPAAEVSSRLPTNIPVSVAVRIPLVVILAAPRLPMDCRKIAETGDAEEPLATPATVMSPSAVTFTPPTVSLDDGAAPPKPDRPHSPSWLRPEATPMPNVSALILPLVLMSTLRERRTAIPIDPRTSFLLLDVINRPLALIFTSPPTAAMPATPSEGRPVPVTNTSPLALMTFFPSPLLTCANIPLPRAMTSPLVVTVALPILL